MNINVKWTNKRYPHTSEKKIKSCSGVRITRLCLSTKQKYWENSGYMNPRQKIHFVKWEIIIQLMAK